MYIPGRSTSLFYIPRLKLNYMQRTIKHETPTSHVIGLWFGNRYDDYENTDRLKENDNRPRFLIDATASISIIPTLEDEKKLDSMAMMWVKWSLRNSRTFHCPWSIERNDFKFSSEGRGTRNTFSKFNTQFGFDFGSGRYWFLTRGTTSMHGLEIWVDNDGIFEAYWLLQSTSIFRS